MKVRLVGLALIASGILAGVLFIYLPIRDGPDGFMGQWRFSALLFVPLSIVTGAAFVIGGNPVLWAFQAKPKSKAQLVLVLSILISAYALSGLMFWQLETRWNRAPEQVILDGSPRVPILPSTSARDKIRLDSGRPVPPPR